jgi:flagellar export protein FliJ
MPKFNFRFATVLEVRKKSEQNALVALGAAQRSYQEAIAHKNSLVAELQRSLVRRERLGQEVTPALSFRIEQDYINGTKTRIIRADQGIVRASRGVEKALRTYLHTRKQSRMIEVLEENDRREFRRAVARKEQKQMDELTVMRSRLRDQEESA